jgi:hypothetical protein
VGIVNNKKIMTAAAEAKRFLERVRQYQENEPQYEFSPSKEGGALKRASMDLTRALADLRRSS